MSKVLWVLTIFVSYVVHDTFALPPEVPQTPSWDNLSIEKPRSSVIPTWYDVLVTPQATKEVEPKNKTGAKSYAELRESLALNQLNLPEVVQKKVVLEADEIDIPNNNSKNLTKKTGTKMKDLYKSRFQKTKKEMKAELMNNYLIPKLVITEQPKNNKKQKEYFPKEEKKPLPPLNSSVPLYVPIFRPQTNNKKKTTQRILEKPEFVKPSLNNQETIQNDGNKQSIITQSKDNTEYVPTVVDNKPVVDKETEQTLNEKNRQHAVEESEENHLINKVIQAIKDGELKLDDGQLKLNTENLPESLGRKVKCDQQNNVKMTNKPLDYVQTYPHNPQLLHSKTPQFEVQQPIHQQLTEPFKPIVVEIMNPQLLNKKPANQQPISESPVHQQSDYQQSLNQQCVNQQDVKQQYLIEQLLNQQQFNQHSTSESPVHQQPLDQQILNQFLLNQQSMNQQSMHQQSINQQTLHPETLNQQALNQEPLNEQQIIELINQQLMNQQSLNPQHLNQETLNQPPIIQRQKSVNQQLSNQELINQQVLNRQPMNQQCVNQQNLNQKSLYQQSLSRQPINQQLLDQQSMHQQCVNQKNLNLDSFNQQQIIELLSQLQLSYSPSTISLENIACSNPDKKIPEILNIPNSSNMNSRIHPRVNNFKESQIEIQDMQKPVEITQKDSKNNPVLTVFKPGTVSLWETYGNFLKKLTMTVLVPVHAEKLLT